jgi:hypothetical protein
MALAVILRKGSLDKKFRWYLAGPMSGIEDYNFPLFHETARRLRALGAEVVSPAELDTDPDTNKASSDPYPVCLKKDLAALLTCDGIVLLENWENSNGACLEVRIAQMTQMVIITLENFLDYIKS